jgi:predicted cytidylate kinase
MAVPRSVVLNGDLGSGKSTVSKLLAERLGIRRVSVGDLYRAMAAQRGMTAVQFNLHAELDDKIDHYVDQLQADIADSGEQVVVDSRLAWHFFADALKVHMIADPTVAATRVLARPGDAVERYATVEEARSRLTERSESERMRFLTRYGVDKTRLRNYDLVCDSTSAAPEDIVERIAEQLEADGTGGPALWLDPRRIRPDGVPSPARTLAVRYAAPDFFAVEGQELVSEAIEAGRPLVEARLVAES